MALPPSAHAAVPAAVGYYHQGLFALVTLLDAEDGASVSVETDDDVVLDGPVQTLHQLKHSLGTPPTLTVANEGLWKTFAIWCAAPLDGSVNFQFVTCAPVDPAGLLSLLTQPKSGRSALVSALEVEANRVKAERVAVKKGDPKPHAKRWPGCEAFLKLNAKARAGLVELITLAPSSFTAAQVPHEVSKRLRSCVPPAIRDAVVERLIEWWDRQVVLSLLGKRGRQLHKGEMQNRLHELLVEHSPQGLPDDYSFREPAMTGGEVGQVMAKQIEWVNGGSERLRRAVIARWRARNQRGEWLDKDISIAPELDRLDGRLIEVWRSRFGPMAEDCAGCEDGERCKRGLGILDWSHHDAHRDLPPIRPNWPHAYLVQGSLQQLSEQGELGWHPDYVIRVKAMKAGGS